MNNILLQNLPILDIIFENCVRNSTKREAFLENGFNNEEEILILFDILNLKNNEYYLNLVVEKLCKNSEISKLNVGSPEERKIILRHILLNIFNDKID